MYIYVHMQADATVAPTYIDIIYILHVYPDLCVITIYCKCVSTNNYCLLSIVYLNTFDKYGYLAFIFSHYEIYHQERARGNLTIDD